MIDQYFQVVKYIDDDYQIITYVHIKYEKNIWKDIYENHVNISEFSERFLKDPYGAIYKFDFKDYLKNYYTDAYDIIKRSLSTINENINNSDIKIWLSKDIIENETSNNN